MAIFVEKNADELFLKLKSIPETSFYTLPGVSLVTLGRLRVSWGPHWHVDPEIDGFASRGQKITQTNEDLGKQEKSRIPPLIQKGSPFRLVMKMVVGCDEILPSKISLKIHTQEKYVKKTCISSMLSCCNRTWRNDVSKTHERNLVER